MSSKRLPTSSVPSGFATLPRLAIITAMLITLSACGPTVVRPNADDKAIAAATQLVTQGQHTAAADAFLRLAANEKPPFKQGFELDAVEQLLYAADQTRAAQILGGVDMGKADDALRNRHQLLGARLAIMNSDPSRALALLGAEYPLASVADRTLRLQLRVIARKQLGQTLPEIRERLQLAGLLGSSDQARRNLNDIWAALGQLPDTDLQALAANPVEPDLRAWAELAMIDRASRFDYLGFQAYANDWRVRHPNHAAAGAFLDGLLANYSAPLATPASIALLLPLSGRYEAQAAAVRDGFFAAHFERQTQTGNPVTVRVYDTGDGQVDVAALYAQAVADGAAIVVGPLAKPAVETLASIPDLQVPVLALNRADRVGTSSKFYQFGLPPEDEAVAIAQRAMDSGLTRALVIASEGAWGNRLSDALQAALSQRGGQVLATARLPATSSDYREVLEQVLLLDQSDARRRDVSSRLGEKVEFEPRRRGDAQIILVATDDRQMRSLRPQLEFHHAEDLPILALSNVYSGRPDATADRDLNGVVFADSPWRIDDATIAPSERLAVDRFWPERNAQAGNLFALGVDAYRLLPYVPRLTGNSDTTIEGANGGLYLDAERQVHRRPIFAVFRAGVPTRAPEATPPAPLEPPANPDATLPSGPLTPVTVTVPPT